MSADPLADVSAAVAQRDASGTLGQSPGTTSSSGATDITAASPTESVGGLMAVILQALQSIGVGGTGTFATASAGSASVALSSIAGSISISSEGLARQELLQFLQSLLAALQPHLTTSSTQEVSSAPPAGLNIGASGTTSGVQAAIGSGGVLAAALQSATQSLLATLGESSAAATSGTTANSSAAALQASFDTVVTALGGSTTGSSSLSAFLQALAGELEGVSNSGNVVNTHAPRRVLGQCMSWSTAQCGRASQYDERSCVGLDRSIIRILFIDDDCP